MSDKSQKTEKPTARRQEKARKEGQFPTAKDFVSAVQFLAFVAMLAWWGVVGSLKPSRLRDCYCIAHSVRI